MASNDNGRIRESTFYKEVLPFTAMVSMECINVGLNTLYKAATNKGMSNHVFVVYSYGVAAILLLPSPFFSTRSRLLPPLSSSILGKIFLLGVIGCTSQIMGYTGINYSSPTLASAISNLVPAFTFVLAVIFRMEKIELKRSRTRAKVLGTLVSIAGAFVVTLYKGPKILVATTSTPNFLTQPLSSAQSNWMLGGLFLTTEYFLVPMWYIVQIIHSVDKLNLWHRLPVFFGLLYLGGRRHLHQQYNLINVGRTPTGVRSNPADYPYRTADGKYNDPFNEGAGSEFSFFGRNMLPVDQHNKLKKPDPMVVATKLLARRNFVDTGKQFNIIAASWIQFMIHDWIDHLEATEQIELTAPKEVASQCPLKSFKFYKSKEIPTGFYDIKTGYLNSRTPWWDGSAVYGSNAEVLKKVRTYKDGKLKLSEDGLIQQDENGNIISGDVRNTWAGLLALQALFVKEHNAVCDTLKKAYPELEDEELYRHARLVTSAVIAKVHTIDWTVELLKTDTMEAGMRINWYGLLGKKFKDTFGHIGGSALGGFVGMKKPENHGVPYSLTEEFVSVYRMHQLLPDKLQLRNIDATPGPNKSLPLIDEIPMENLIGSKAVEQLSRISFTKQMVSMGHQACGALELWNYPMWMRDLIPQDVDGKDRPDHIDLAALEIYRDRERSVARYNEFRRRMLQIPISKWEDLTDDEEAIETLREVYGDDVEELDVLVGMMAEKKIKGFAISETAFFMFLLMAARRLEADRFFTSNFNEETYTKKGFEWVNTTESLKDVLDRHYPEMTQKWMNSSSAFSVWDSAPKPHNPIPLYLRVPQH